MLISKGRINYVKYSKQGKKKSYVKIKRMCSEEFQEVENRYGHLQWDGTAMQNLRSLGRQG